MKNSEEHAYNQENITYYCSKCAIDLALKGIRVYDIESEQNNSKPLEAISKKGSLHSYEGSPNNHEKNKNDKEALDDNLNKMQLNSRKKEIEEFLIKIAQSKKNGYSSFSLLQKRKEEINNFYQQQVLKTEEFFKRMEIVLQTNKRILTDKLQKFREDTENLFKNQVKQTEFSLSEIEKIEFDITENVDNILKNMEELPFKTIITKYDNKIAQFQKNFVDLYKEPLILNKILISINNYKENETNYSKFNEEVWNLIRPYISFNRIPVTFLEEFSDSDCFASPRKEHKRENFVSFENKDFFEEKSQKSNQEDDEKRKIYYYNDKANKKNGECYSSVESLCSPTSKKYLDLLNKINNNQESNQIFFTNLLCKTDSSAEIEKKKTETKIYETPLIHDSFQKDLLFSPNFREKQEI